MLTGILGLGLSMILLINGFAALRRPISLLIQHDPLGKKLLASRGKAFTRIAYRAYGVAFVVLGLAIAFLSLSWLRG